MGSTEEATQCMRTDALLLETKAKWIAVLGVLLNLSQWPLHWSGVGFPRVSPQRHGYCVHIG